MDNVTLEDKFTGKRHEIKIGDWVCFKSDIEQSGKVIRIQQRDGDWITWNKREIDYVLVLENENGFIGGYIGGDTKTVVRLKDIWVD